MNRLESVLSCAALSVAACASGDGGARASDEIAHEISAPFEIVLGSEHVQLHPGERATLDLTLQRAPGFVGEVTFVADGLPAGTELGAQTIDGATERVSLAFRALVHAAHSLPTDVTIRAQSGESTLERSVVVTVLGAAGERDTSFEGGVVATRAGEGDDYARAVITQPDGKIVIAGRSSENLGDIALVRLARDGALDPTFGLAGVVTTDIAHRADAAHAMALQPDGKILVAGSTDTDAGLDFVLLRYGADGQLDAQFGDRGVVITAFTSDSDVAYALLLQADGKVVLGGHANLGRNHGGLDFALARYTSDGALDGAFGAAGKLTTSLSAASGRDTIYALTEQHLDGRRYIVAAGGEGDFAAARYGDDGSLDLGFGQLGKVLGPFGATIGAAKSVAITADGLLVLAGQIAHEFALAGLRPDGTLDSSFGEAGTILTSLGERGWNEAESMVLQEDGKIVSAGWCHGDGASNGDFALVRYTAAGVLDESFGQGGIVIAPATLPGEADEAHAIALQRDSRIPVTRAIVVGHASVSFAEFVTARFWL